MTGSASVLSFIILLRYGIADLVLDSLWALLFFIVALFLLMSISSARSAGVFLSVVAAGALLIFFPIGVFGMVHGSAWALITFAYVTRVEMKSRG